MLVRLDEGSLQNVFGNIRTSRHAECMSVKGIAVADEQDTEGVLRSGEHPADDLLIRIDLINGEIPLLHRAHAASVTRRNLAG